MSNQIGTEKLYCLLCAEWTSHQGGTCLECYAKIMSKSEIENLRVPGENNNNEPSFKYSEQELKEMFSPQEVQGEKDELVRGVVKRLADLKIRHINPYNLGEEGEIGNLIDTLAKMFKL